MTAPPITEESVCEWLRAAIGRVLGVPVAGVDVAVRFRDLGLGSLQITELIRQLSEHVARPLSPTLPWERPTPLALARYVAGERRGADHPEGSGSQHVSPSRNDDPIAVIGIGCRLPGGVRSPAELWKLLCEGRSGIREVPRGRWDAQAFLDEDPSKPGKMNTRWGGFLDDPAGFDPAFFAISHREARQMDPQQRLLLEIAWEALEDARIDPLGLQHRRVGVFVGAAGSDYARLTSIDLDLVDQHTATGQDTSIISARVSYSLGLRGPSLTVNTACSSSLVAIHLACQSLRSGESSMALAGGVQLVLSPHGTVAMTKFGAMNPAGQCRAFDASANGYVRGEGGGVVVLKPLGRAIADGDRIYCVIRGSSVNNDGFSNGLTAPNPEAQQAMLVDAYASAGIDPGLVHYIETHGPGTILGDPIEAGAIGAVLGPSHSAERPLRIGSVKTNIGHLEAAAGVAGLMKVALSLHHRMLPASLGFDRPNPHIPFEQLHLEVQTELEEWPRWGEVPRAGVSSFGFGGTNSHVVLEAVPRSDVVLLPLAAETQDGLQRLVRAVSSVVERVGSGAEAAAACREIARRCGRGTHRVAVRARDRDELDRELASLRTRPPAPRRTASKPRLVFVCPGQGSQWLGMGRSLLLREPVFRAEIEACDRSVRALRGWSLLDELTAGESASRLNDGDVVQLALFGVDAALGKLWRSWGIEPDALVGHSMGEAVAAYLAGVLSRDAAIRVIAERSLLVTERALGHGAMLSVTFPEERLLDDVLRSASGLGVAAFNSPTSVVLSGTPDAVARAEAQLAELGMRAERVNVEYASHGPQMEPLMDPLRERLRSLAPRTATVPLRSTVTEEWLRGPECGAEYWAQNLRNPVRFRHAVEALAREESTVFVELSPHPVLLKPIEQTLQALDLPARVLPTCERGADERGSMLASLSALFELGFDPRWDVVLGHEAPALDAADREAITQVRDVVLAATAETTTSTDHDDRQVTAREAAQTVPILLSARTEAALWAQAERLREHLVAHPELELPDVAYSLATSRSHFEHRAAAVAHDREELLEVLTALANGSPVSGTVLGSADKAGKLAVLLTGQGSQRPGMGRALAEAFPAFRDALDAACAHLDRELERPLREVLFAEEGAPEAALLDETAFTQPALFVIEVALFRLFESWGVRPDLLVGHSIGELAAAHVAGVLSLEDACTLVAARGRLMQALPRGGAMVSLQAAEDEVAPRLAGRNGQVSIAALNGPASTVISGDEEAVLEVARHFEALGRKTTRLRVSHAFHSPRMDGMLDAFRDVASKLSYGAPRIPIVSNVTGKLASAEELGSAEYWVRHVRQAVRFLDGVRTLEAEGATTFLELGPQGVLCAMGQECLSEGARGRAAFLPALRKDRPEPDVLTSALSSLHAHGQAVDWTAFFAPAHPRRVQLPTYAFQRERFWLDAPRSRSDDVASAGLSSADHPLLGAVVPLADSDGFVFTGRLSLAEHPWLAGHAVFGSVILPGTAFVELALAAAHRVGLERVEELTLEAPLALPAKGAVVVQLSVGAPDEAGRRPVAVHAQPEGAATWTRHAAGLLGPAAPADTFDLHTWPPQGATPLPLDGAYDRIAALGFGYGPEFQGLKGAWRRGEELFAEARLPDGLEPAGFGLHPALLDSALHACLLEGAAEAAVPFSWTGVSLRAVGASSIRVRLARGGGDALSLQIADAAGEPVASVAALATRPASAGQVRGALGAPHDALFRVDWTALVGTSASTSPGGHRVLLGADELGLGAALEAASARLDRHPDLAALRGAIANGAPAPEVVVAAFPPRDEKDLVAAAHAATAGALALLQAWLADERLASTRLVLVTRRAVAAGADEDVFDLVHAPLWGLVRSTQAEHPDRGIALLDVDGEEASRQALPAAVASEEPQLALRSGALAAPRLARRLPTDTLAPPEAVTWRLGIPAHGTLDAFKLVPHPEAAAPLAEGEVRIAVRAAGLNFRDALIALGMYPGNPGFVGNEGAGVVVETGPGVTSVAVGDRIMGMFPCGFGPVAIADQRSITRIPEGWSFAEAASVPTVFLTAYYALVELARLQPGERILVHAAAGGVGTAAVQLARHLGAEVFATASPGKWPSLRALGFDESHLASSRTLDFEPHFRRSTGGRGVDVVLDSLAREFVDASLRLLPPGGRFLEMGKTDVRDAQAVAAQHPAVGYRAFDLAEAGPERIAQMLGELTALFERGVLRPPPVTAWDVRRAPEAFRALAQARLVGKVVLTVPRELNGEGTVLVTGATGTLGGLVARHLVQEHGARHLLLASRKGLAAPGAEVLKQELEAAGASVTVAACDVADRAALEALLASIPAAHPLTAVVHAAGVLDDGVLGALTPERLATVLRAKVDAALNLHALTEELDLSAFVLFSSAAGVLGTPGQASYAAANAFLDALAHHRKARGLPALSLDWGYWAERSGLTAHLGAADLQRMARMGMRPLSSDEGLALLDAAWATPDATIVPARIDTAALGAADALPHLFRGLVRPRAAIAREPAAASGLEERLRSLSEADRDRALLDLVRSEAAAVLGQRAASAVHPNRPLSEVGLDSLMAVELRNRLSAASGLRLPTTLLFDHPTPSALAKLLREKLLGDGRAPPAATVASRSSRWRAASRAACARPRSSGSSSSRPRTRSPRSRRTAAGTSTSSTTPTPTPGARPTRATAGSSTTSTASTRASSGSARARRSPSTRSTGCSSRPRGKPSSAPASPLPRCTAATAASSWASSRTITPRASWTRLRSWRDTGTSAAQPASRRVASPTPSVSRAPRSPSTRRAARRSSRRTSPARRCATASARSRSRAASRSWRRRLRSSSSAGSACCRPTAGAGPSPPTPTEPAGRRAPASSSSSGSPTRGETAMTCSP